MGRSFGGVDAMKWGISQTVACATTSTAITNAFGAQTWRVRLSLSGTGVTHIRIGDGVQTAATSDAILPAAWVDYVAVTPGQRLSAITETGTATLIVTEAAQ